MTIEALILVISGALLHATWNFFAKKASGGLPFVWLFGLVSITAALPFGLAAWSAHAAPLTWHAWLTIIASAAAHVVYMLTLQKGYRAADFSVVYPLARGTGPLFAVAGAILVLAEAPRFLGWLGIGAITAGIFLISGSTELFSASRRSVPGMLWGCLTGLFIAVYTLIDGWAVKVVGLPPVLFYVLGLGLRTLLLAPLALRQPQSLVEQWRQNKGCILAVGMLSPLAYTLVLFAMTRAPLSYVAPIREISMLAGAWVGARMLRERFSVARVAGIVLMVTGVVLLAVA